MKLDFLGYYLIIINVIGFILFAVNTWLYSHTAQKQVDNALTITSLLGGSVGILLSIMIFDRRVEKGNMMSRVFIACVFVIQLIIFLILKGHVADNITFAFWTFFNNHKILIVYLGIINFITFAAFALDKIAAMEHRSRIKIVTLLGLAFIGGSLGGLLAMYLFRHKINKDYFTVGIFLMIIMQIVVIFYLMNISW
jgi:uncharacterized membrane protein YsdA (DUF1294 family)